MPDSNTPLILVVCNDYGELALAMYLIGQQSFAQNTTLMLPPKLHAQNPDILPGRTFVYHAMADIQERMETLPPGVLGLFSGYLLPIHRLSTVEELNSLLESAQAQDWKHFTSDPFLALLDDVDASELVTLTAPKWNILWAYFAAKEKKRLSHLLTESNRVLNQTLHVYPCGTSTTEPVTPQNGGGRLHFHNNDFLSQPGYTPAAAADKHTQRWLFILGDQDYTVQEGKYGSTIWAQGMSRKFRKVLVRKLNEALEAGRVPTLIAPTKVIESVRKHSRAADAMELLGHCDYAHFQSLLLESEYVFYWNAVSFSCLVRTLSGKPWFTFDDGHLLRGMNNDYAKRIFDWFYQGDEPPRLDIETTLTADSLLQATQQYLKPAWRVQQALLVTADVQNLLSTLYPGEAQPQQGSSGTRPQPASLSDAFQVLQQLGEVISSNHLDGSFVVDSDLLAHSKSDITSAAALMIEHGESGQAEFARSAVPTLAFFQSGVGDNPHPIDSASPDGKPWRAAVESDMLKIVGSLPKGPTSNP